MTTVCIANRGEIAVRIIRACRETGLRTVALYSEADRDAPHVALADAAYLLGSSLASESYLNIDRVLEVARLAGADAIHPGYGFLSENADFAEACERAGFGFIGPPSAVIRLLGDKIRAKRLMADAGVPVVPGYEDEDQTDARLAAEAARIGTPLLIKSAAGGGGRGMRVVLNLADFPAELEEARREAGTAFKDDRVLLEKYIERSRHVEVQIIGDTHGNVIHLFERECSIQRRHQKIIEESPSPALTPALRAQMTEAAVAAGRAAGYVNAGTVEFLVEEQPGSAPNFYFLEVNTRLQVEHPVTEMLTGIDLVKLQLRVAAGEALPISQEDVRSSGHAMESRIYAEDPAAGFLPSLGTLELWLPPQGPWVRVDSGVERGGEVSPYYDPMLAKLIVRGENREEAVARMDSALRDFHVLGVKTNVPFLSDVIRHPEFQAGHLSTRFLADHFPLWRPPEDVPDEVLLAIAAEAVTRPEARITTENDSAEVFDPWHSGDCWRNA